MVATKVIVKERNITVKIGKYFYGNAVDTSEFVKKNEIEKILKEKIEKLHESGDKTIFKILTPEQNDFNKIIEDGLYLVTEEILNFPYQTDPYHADNQLIFPFGVLEVKGQKYDIELGGEVIEQIFKPAVIEAIAGVYRRLVYLTHEGEFARATEWDSAFNQNNQPEKPETNDEITNTYDYYEKFGKFKHLKIDYDNFNYDAYHNREALSEKLEIEVETDEGIRAIPYDTSDTLINTDDLENKKIQVHLLEDLSIYDNYGIEIFTDIYDYKFYNTRGSNAVSSNVREYPDNKDHYIYKKGQRFLKTDLKELYPREIIIHTHDNIDAFETVEINGLLRNRLSDDTLKYNYKVVGNLRNPIIVLNTYRYSSEATFEYYSQDGNCLIKPKDYNIDELKFNLTIKNREAIISEGIELKEKYDPFIDPINGNEESSKAKNYKLYSKEGTLLQESGFKSTETFAHTFEVPLKNWIEGVYVEWEYQEV